MEEIFLLSTRYRSAFWLYVYRTISLRMAVTLLLI